MLSSIDLAASAEVIDASAAVNAWLFGATDEERVAAIVTAARRFHDILQRAVASAPKGGLRRETTCLSVGAGRSHHRTALLTKPQDDTTLMS